MPKVWLNQDGIHRDITELVTNITWGGSKSEVARKVEVGLINPIIDKSIPKLFVKNGSIIKLFNENGTELFKGFVFFNERTSGSNTVNIVAYDHLIYTLKSKGNYNFKNKTAEEITATLCLDFQIPKGNLTNTGIKQSFIANSKTIYEIFMQAYTSASKQNNKQYMARIRAGKLDVIEIGSVMSNFVLSDESNITDSSYSESIENMINSIQLYDEKGNKVGLVENAEWVKKYGLLQDIYTREKDKQANTVAKTMLKDIEKSISVEVLGNIDCVTGNGIKLKDSATGLESIFYIDSDKHTWKNGQHSMQLKLNFKSVMDEKKGDVG